MLMKYCWPTTFFALCCHHEVETVIFFERLKASTRINKLLTLFLLLTLSPLFISCTERKHLQNFMIFRENGNNPSFHLRWPTCCKDSHAMSFSSTSFTGVFISLAQLVCQHTDESPIGWMSIHSVWAGCLGMLEGLIFISDPSRYLGFACILMMDMPTMNANRNWSRKSENGWEWWKGEETITGKIPHQSVLLEGFVGNRFQICGD